MGELGRAAAAAAVLSAVVLLVAALAGQAGQLRLLLGWLGPHLEPWRLAGHATVLFAEATLPLAALLAGGLAYGRARREGVLLALSALGLRPARLWAPALWLGLAGGGAAWAVSHEAAPCAAQALRAELAGAAGAAVAQPPQGAARLGAAVVARDGAAWWAAWGAPSSGWVLRAVEVAGQVEAAGLAVTLSGVHLWGPGVRIRAGTASVRLRAPLKLDRLRQFGPPNALPTAQLDPADRHHRFVRHRRWAMGAAAVPWALWAASLGAALPALWALPLGALGLAASYWVLRVGELAARAGFGSPALAAWAPVLLAALGLALWLPRALKRVGHPP